MKPKIKIAYVINHLSFFNSHILPLAEEAKKKGYNIHIFCGKGGSQIMEKKAENIIKKKGFTYSKLNIVPGLDNLFLELLIIFKIIKQIKKFEPDIVHGISIKAVLYSCLYAFFFRPKKLICFITGMGYFFTNKLVLYEKIFKFLILKIIKLGLFKKNSKLIIENIDDLKFFIKNQKVNKRKIIKLSGVGVNLKKFYYVKKKKQKIVLFPARILIEKGINEFYLAATILSKKYKNWRFLIAGTIDYHKNNKKVVLPTFKENESIIFLGHVENIHKIFNKTSIVCLPSYREGYPKSLIEACSSGCSIVASDVPGCREVVKNNFNGYLCKARSHIDLKNMIEKLILNEKMRIKFSKNSRKIAKNNYDFKIFVKANIKEYKML